MRVIRIGTTRRPRWSAKPIAPIALTPLLTLAWCNAGLRYRAPEGAYYIMADYSTVFEGTPVAFARHMAREIGVTCIPTETFYGPAHAHLGQNYVRFAFCKEDAVLREAGMRLMRLIGQ